MYIIYGIYFVSLFLAPVGLSMILNSKNHNSNSEKILIDFQHMSKNIKVLFISLIVIFLVKMFILNEKSADILLWDVTYFTIFIVMIIFINYFSTRYDKFKNCIMIFLDKTVDFIKDNFILNLLFVTLIVFIKRYDDLTIGVISSYVFFALTSIHQEYKKFVNDNNKGFKKLYIVMQTLLNICLVYSFSTIERIISGFSQKTMIPIEGKDIICSLLLIIVIIINYFLPSIELYGSKIYQMVKNKLKI